MRRWVSLVKIVLWCNGSTAVFGSACRGSNPRKTTVKEQPAWLLFCVYCVCMYFFARCPSVFLSIVASLWCLQSVNYHINDYLCRVNMWYMQIYQRKTRLLTNTYDYCDSAIRWRNNLATYSCNTSSHHRGDDPKNCVILLSNNVEQHVMNRLWIYWKEYPTARRLTGW